jgi:transposase
MTNKFIPIDRNQLFVIPVQEWLSNDHLARFIVAVIEGLDVSALEASYSGGGSPCVATHCSLTRTTFSRS